MNILKKLRQHVRFVIESIDIYIVNKCSQSRIGSILYYLVFSREFGREQQAILAGRWGYRSNLKSASNSALLRRNIHRMEKGLCMQSRRNIFALEYVFETVNCYREMMNNNCDMHRELLEWASSVLRMYFLIVKPVGVIAQAEKSFLNVETKYGAIENNKVPYPRSKSVCSHIEYLDFYNLCMQRRSVRWYQDKIVPKEMLSKAVEVAVLAPSACNRQPFDFFIINDPKQAREIATIPMGTAGFVDNIQCLVVIVGKLDSFFAARDRHIIYLDGALAAMQFMLSLETLGLSSCPINWPDVEALEIKMSAALKLSHMERPVLLLSVGFAQNEGMIPYSQKRSIVDIVKWV